jgi:phosphate butyryltransferase
MSLTVKTFEQLLLTNLQKKHQKLVVACADDDHVLDAINTCYLQGVIEPILIGDSAKIVSLLKKNKLNLNHDSIVNVQDRIEAAKKAVEIVRANSSSILMKGNISTRDLLKAVLSKDKGLPCEGVLSHVAIFESPYYHKLFMVTDAAMNIAPDFDQKVCILNNAISVAHKFGIALPKVAVVSSVEKVNPKIEATVHAARLTQMNEQGQINGCLIYGPLALDNAISVEAAKNKGIENPVAGDADIILVPDLNSGNILYKSLAFLGGAKVAGIIVGTTVPIVLTSRADSEESKLWSIKVAVSLCN